MILLDTNVLSALMHDPPDPSVLAGADGQVPEELWTTSISVFEIRSGLDGCPPAAGAVGWKQRSRGCCVRTWAGALLRLTVPQRLRRGIWRCAGRWPGSQRHADRGYCAGLPGCGRDQECSAFPGSRDRGCESGCESLGGAPLRSENRETAAAPCAILHAWIWTTMPVTAR